MSLGLSFFGVVPDGEKVSHRVRVPSLPLLYLLRSLSVALEAQWSAPREELVSLIEGEGSRLWYIFEDAIERLGFKEAIRCVEGTRDECVGGGMRGQREGEGTTREGAGVSVCAAPFEQYACLW